MLIKGKKPRGCRANLCSRTTTRLQRQRRRQRTCGPVFPRACARAGAERERLKTHACTSSEQVGPHSRAPRCFPPCPRDAWPSTTACSCHDLPSLATRSPARLSAPSPLPRGCRCTRSCWPMCAQLRPRAPKSRMMTTWTSSRLLARPPGAPLPRAP